MNVMSNTTLHSAKFDLCRLCMREPENSRHVKFMDVIQNNLADNIFKIFGIKIENNDINPKIICECCYQSMLIGLEMRKKADETQILINYLAKKKFGNYPPGDDQLVLAYTSTEDVKNIQLMDVGSTSEFRSTINCLENPMPSTSSAIDQPTNGTYSLRSTRSQTKSMASASSAGGQSTSRLTRSQTSAELTNSVGHQSTSYGRSARSSQQFSPFVFKEESD